MRTVPRESPSARAHGTSRSSNAEPLAIWALIALVAACVVATYARLPTSELYHVSRNGAVGGFSRALVLIDFPFALVAVALALIAFDSLRTRVAAVVALGSVLLSAAVAWPGVVDQADLDARAVNVVPALGVVLALALTVWSARVAVPAFARRLPLDIARIVVATGLITAGLPWLFAEAGFSISRVPGLDRVFLGGQIRASGGGETLQVVHLGHHHGADGLYLVLSALLLSRVLVRLGRIRPLVSAYLALMLAYGFANIVQDFWTEQVVKRGWAKREIPSLLHPSLSLGWAAILLLATCVELGAFRWERRHALQKEEARFGAGFFA
jgi:hypothetical protein